MPSVVDMHNMIGETVTFGKPPFLFEWKGILCDMTLLSDSHCEFKVNVDEWTCAILAEHYLFEKNV